MAAKRSGEDSRNLGEGALVEGRRSTRPRILRPSSKTLTPLAKEPALPASYWPRSRTGRSGWSRLWVGWTACQKSPPIPPNHNFESSRQLIDLQLKSKKSSSKIEVKGGMTSKIVFNCTQSTWPVVNIDFEKFNARTSPIIYNPTG